jgi:hypothetical protein
MMGKRKNTSKVAVMRSVARAILLELTIGYSSKVLG